MLKSAQCFTSGVAVQLNTGFTMHFVYGDENLNAAVVGPHQDKIDPEEYLEFDFRYTAPKDYHLTKQYGMRTNWLRFASKIDHKRQRPCKYIRREAARQYAKLHPEPEVEEVETLWL